MKLILLISYDVYYKTIFNIDYIIINQYFCIDIDISFLNIRTMRSSTMIQHII